MAKSTRSKIKRSFRSKKRESGVYAATEAARLQRLSAKITAVASTDNQGDMALGDGLREQLPGSVEDSVDKCGGLDSMDIDGSVASRSGDKSRQISTHGPRGSRREVWRASKGLDPLPKRKGMNRQGGIAARRKSGRSSRRR